MYVVYLFLYKICTAAPDSLSSQGITSSVFQLTPTYQGLHHEDSFCPHVTQELVHVDRVLHLHPLQHAIQQDEGARPAHTRTAVYQHGRAVFAVVLPHTADEGDEGGSKLRHPVVRPAEEVVVGHRKGRGIWL